MIYDLGCGTGELTAVLAKRWPEAQVIGIDSSEEMLERASKTVGTIEWRLGEISSWSPDRPAAVIFSNATLHWIPGHATLFRRLVSGLSETGVLAVQMPDNWGEPTHRVPAEILDEGEWPEPARKALMRDRVASPTEYAKWVGTESTDIWRTTYYQRLEGEDPVWEWVTGSLLRPVLATLEDEDRARFENECKRRYKKAYPPGPDGTTTLAFSRLFLVAPAR